MATHDALVPYRNFRRYRCCARRDRPACAWRDTSGAGQPLMQPTARSVSVRRFAARARASARGKAPEETKAT